MAEQTAARNLTWEERTAQWAAMEQPDPNQFLQTIWPTLTPEQQMAFTALMSRPVPAGKMAPAALGPMERERLPMAPAGMAGPTGQAAPAAQPQRPVQGETQMYPRQLGSTPPSGAAAQPQATTFGSTPPGGAAAPERAPAPTAPAQATQQANVTWEAQAAEAGAPSGTRIKLVSGEYITV